MRKTVDSLISTLELWSHYVEILAQQLGDILIAIHFSESARRLAQLIAVRDDLESAIHALAEGSTDGHEVIAEVQRESEQHIIFIEQSPALRDCVMAFFNPPIPSEALA